MKIISFNYIVENLNNEIFFQESEKFYFKFQQYFSRDLNEIRYLVFINLIDKEYFLGMDVNENEKELLISNYYFFINGENKIFNINNTLELIQDEIMKRNTEDE